MHRLQKTEIEHINLAPKLDESKIQIGNYISEISEMIFEHVYDKLCYDYGQDFINKIDFKPLEIEFVRAYFKVRALEKIDPPISILISMLKHYGKEELFLQFYFHIRMAIDFKINNHQKKINFLKKVIVRLEKTLNSKGINN